MQMQFVSPELPAAGQLRRYAADLAIRKNLGAELPALDDALLRALSKASAQRLRVAMSPSHVLQEPNSEAPPISAVFIRPVGDRCNLACTYCYQTHIRNETTNKRMTFDTLRATLEQVAKTPTRPISFSWHGGEPLLAGKDFFRKAIEIQSELFPQKGEIFNSVQTNGILLDDEWFELFKRAGFAVGISVDGPRHINDKTRVTKGGASTYDSIIRNIDIARRFNIPLNAICVVGEQHAAQATSVFNTLRSLEIIHCNLQPDFGTNQQGHPNHVSAKTFSEFVCEFWDLWKNEPAPYMHVRFFDNFLLQLLEGQGDDCVFSGECSRLIAVSESGNLRPCSRPIHGYAAMGDINLIPTSGANHSIFRKFRAEDMLSQRRAKNCSFIKLCNHGCPQHRVNSDGEQCVSGTNVFCGCSNEEGIGYNTIWRHMLSDIEKTLRLADKAH